MQSNENLLVREPSSGRVDKLRAICGRDLVSKCDTYSNAIKVFGARIAGTHKCPFKLIILGKNRLKEQASEEE